MSVPIVILASGRGSNFDSIMASIRSGELDAEVVALVSDRAEAGALKKAQAQGVRTRVIPPPVAAGGGPAVWPGGIEERRRRHEEALLSELRLLSPHFLVLAGYMRIVTPLLIDAFRSARGYSRMVNIHPSLLPAFPGTQAYAQAYRHGVQMAGVTVHLVEPEVDSGPICAQEAFSIADCRSADEVQELGLAVEHRLYPRALKWILPEKFSLEERRVCVRSN